MNDAVLVFGATGFVGRALVPAIAAAGQHVIAIGRTGEPFPQAGVETIFGEFSAPEHFLPWLRQTSIVVHLAAASTPSSSAGAPLTELDQNLRPTLALLDAMQSMPQCALLYVSTGGALYGNTDDSPAREQYPIHPKSYYGAAKAAAEHFICSWTEQFSAAATILRPSNIYGPGQTARRGFAIIPTAFEKVRGGHTLSVWGNGEAVRDYLYVDDFIQLCLEVIARPTPRGTRLFNAASGIGVSLNDLLAAIETVTGKQLQREYLPARTTDVAKILLDPESAYAAYGWQPNTPLADGLKKTWNWYQAVT